MARAVTLLPSYKIGRVFPQSGTLSTFDDSPKPAVMKFSVSPVGQGIDQAKGWIGLAENGRCLEEAIEVRSVRGLHHRGKRRTCPRRMGRAPVEI